jgi:AhpD family alkylhydroperoxidase
MKQGFTQAADDVLAGIELIRRGAPEAMKAFGGLALAATATRAIDTKTKELMALAISIAVHCEGCVAYHARAAVKHGATRQEVAETVALAVSADSDQSRQRHAHHASARADGGNARPRRWMLWRAGPRQSLKSEYEARLPAVDDEATAARLRLDGDPSMAEG